MMTEDEFQRRVDAQLAAPHLSAILPEGDGMVYIKNPGGHAINLGILYRLAGVLALDRDLMTLQVVNDAILIRIHKSNMQ